MWTVNINELWLCKTTAVYLSSQLPTFVLKGISISLTGSSRASRWGEGGLATIKSQGAGYLGSAASQKLSAVQV